MTDQQYPARQEGDPERAVSTTKSRKGPPEYRLTHKMQKYMRHCHRWKHDPYTGTCNMYLVIILDHMYGRSHQCTRQTGRSGTCAPPRSERPLTAVGHHDGKRFERNARRSNNNAGIGYPEEYPNNNHNSDNDAATFEKADDHLPNEAGCTGRGGNGGKSGIGRDAFLFDLKRRFARLPAELEQH